MSDKLKFYFNGCSGTFGDDLAESERELKNWPNIVSRHHDAECYNRSEAGTSNKSIVSDVIQNYDKYDRLYIQWTHINRFTMIDSQSWEPVNFSPRLHHSSFKSKNYYSQYGKYHYAHWATPVFLFKDWLELVILTQNFLESKNKWFLMISNQRKAWDSFTVTDHQTFIDNVESSHDITNIPDSMILDVQTQIQSLLPQIDTRRFVVPTTFCMTETSTLGFPHGPTNHPLEEGLAYVAKRVLEIEKTLN